MNADGWQITLQRWLKFNVVGGIGVGVQLMTLAALKSGLHLHYLLATGLAVEATVIHNFIWHERFTWADRTGEKSLPRFAKFNLTTGMFSIFANLAAMELLVGVCGLPYLPANGITIAACSVVNFVVSDRVVFKSSLPCMDGK